MAATKKVLKIPIRIGIGVLLLGILFKIQQITPFANHIIVSALAAIAVLYTIRFWKKEKKQFLDYIKLILIDVWCLNVIFSVLHLPYDTILESITFISFLVWAVLEGTAYFAKENEETDISINQILWNGMVVLGSLSVIGGIMFKILHIGYSDLLLGIGLLLIGAYIFRDTFAGVLEEEDQ
ncbi:hypothetical protein [Spongiimicrobium salis]|uniref:hypothetical protein n=1 Tax=Spongiimicrobium salis TaxID=1667022 RepID=UPI00374CBC97